MSSIMNRYELAQAMQWTPKDMMEKTEPSDAPRYVISVDSQEEVLEIESVVKGAKGEREFL